MAEGFEVYSEVILETVKDPESDEYVFTEDIVKDKDGDFIHGGIYQRSARWKICMKCGSIDTKEKLDEKTHHCAASKGKIKIILPTSWPVLKAFFLSNAYLKALRKLGVEPEPAPKVPVRVPVKQEVEVSTQVATEEEVEVPVKTE
jgi:hypothetical protein